MTDDTADSFKSKSKSQIKREMTALQELGERLVHLKAEQLNRITLPPFLLEAIHEAKKITRHGAKRRQLQFVGRLMRELEEEEIDMIKEFLLLMDKNRGLKKK